MNQKIVGRPTTKLELPNEYVDIPEIGSSFFLQILKRYSLLEQNF